MLEKIISGGQTGMDQIALQEAKRRGIPTGGTAPKNWMTEKGPDPTLGTLYGLVESDKYGYPPRTEQNVIDSDGTVLFGNMSSPGSMETIKFCKKHGKPHIENPSEGKLALWIGLYDIKILNGAGNRGSKVDQFREAFTRKVWQDTFDELLIPITQK